jgi:hypothetical protein
MWGDINPSLEETYNIFVNFGHHLYNEAESDGAIEIRHTVPQLSPLRRRGPDGI